MATRIIASRASERHRLDRHPEGSRARWSVGLTRQLDHDGAQGELSACRCTMTTYLPSGMHGHNEGPTLGSGRRRGFPSSSAARCRECR